MKLKNKNNSKKLILIIIAAIVVVAAASVGTYALIAQKQADDMITDPSAYIDKPISNGIDYSGPTEQEKAEEAAQVERDKQREELDKKPAATVAEITITAASQYDATVEVRAYIANLYESGGKCTATFTKSGQQPITTTTNAMADAKTIQCGALDTPRSKFPQAGVWQMTVSYESSKATGKSAPQEVTVK